MNSSSSPPPQTSSTEPNSECVGPTAENAGKANSCAGCPNQSACASGKPKAEQKTQQLQHANIREALSKINQILLILSGKGGVGKSTVCFQIAHTLASRGYSVGVLDLDLCGPSTARMLGVSGREVHRSGSGWTPVYANPNLSVMSLSFLLQGEDSAVVWRGPRKNGMIGQFLTETNWVGEDDLNCLDYLLIDTPPGTSDEHISIVQYLQGALGVKGNDGQDGDSANLGGALVVTTPEEVAMADVRKELNFCMKTKLPVIGIVENMSSFQVKMQDLKFLQTVVKRVEGQTQQENQDDNNNNYNETVQEDCTYHVLNTLREKCPELLDVFASATVFPAFGTGPYGMAKAFGVPYLGGLPLDPNLLKSCEDGVCFVTSYPDSVGVNPLDDIVDKVLDALPVDDDDVIME